MAKSIKHRGMTLTKAEHDRWHAAHPGKPPLLSKADHDGLLREAEASGTKDSDWHEKQRTDRRGTPGKK
jgi:hypothetical protein